MNASRQELRERYPNKSQVYSSFVLGAIGRYERGSWSYYERSKGHRYERSDPIVFTEWITVVSVGPTPSGRTVRR